MRLKKHLFSLKIIFSSLFMLLFFCFQSPESNDKHSILIKISNLKEVKSNLRIAVYDSEIFFLKLTNAVYKAEFKIVADNDIYVLENIPLGEYAIALFQDKNSNGKMNYNFFGIPSEPFGFSNNVKGLFGPPKFEDCKFTHSDIQTELEIKLF